MVVYTCSKCFKEFSRKAKYDYHLNRKFDCLKNIDEDLLKNNKENEEIINIEEENLHKCESCNKSFSTKQNLKTHFNGSKCEIIINLQKEIGKYQEKIRSLLEENETLRKRDKFLTKNLKKSKSSNDGESSENSLAEFGEEDLSKLSPENMKELFESGPNVFQKYVKLVYLNPDIPDQKNIRITRKDLSSCEIYSEGRFITKTWKNIGENIMKKAVQYINLHKNDFDINSLEKLRQTLSYTDINSENYDTGFVKTIIKLMGEVIYNFK